MQKVAPRLASGLRDFEVPRDGMRRYLYDIWQPLMVLALTASFTAAFFATYDPRASTSESNGFFFCNADGNIEKSDYSYEPFWDARLYFTVNVPFGSFPFSTVKVVDAAWDAMIGRGGQVVAAMVAYRTLRRSLTLTMETSTVTIPCVVSLCGQQVHLGLVGQLGHTMIWHWSSSHPIWRRPFHAGRVRFGLQVFVCVYLLLFSTLASVMTGYRAKLSGYFGYDAEGTGQLFPIDQLVLPRLALYDNPDVNQHTLFGGTLYAYNEIVYPEGVHESAHSDPTTSISSMYYVSEMLAKSRDFEEPYGSLVDYYYTCMAVERWVKSEGSSLFITEEHTYSDGPPFFVPLDGAAKVSLDCAFHNCSCSARGILWETSDFEPRVIIFSSIFIGSRNTTVQLGEVLPITLRGHTESPNWATQRPAAEWHGSNVSEFWADARTDLTSAVSLQNGTYPLQAPYTYMHNGTVLDEALIRKTSRCIAEDAYAWGFSSLLLLTFCCCTIAFAMALILLQTDVYWNSRHDRDHQFHSIYTDVLYLAEELKNTFGQNVEDHLHSPKAFDKKVGEWKQGLRLDVRDLPLSRWQEWRLSRATKRADRKAKIASATDHDSTLELHNLSSRKRRSDTAYHGLIGGDGECNTEAVSKSDDRSSSEELTPSLGGRRTSTVNSFDDGAVLEGSVQGSYHVWGTLAADVVPEGWGSRDQPPTTG